MDCKICFNKFNEKKHRPKSINSCGHTFCNSCINQINRCAICKRDITGINTNYAIIECINNNPRKNKIISSKEHTKLKDEIHEKKSEVNLKKENLIKSLKDQVHKETFRMKKLLLENNKKLMDQINDLETKLNTGIDTEYDEINQDLNKPKLKDDIKSKIKNFENFGLNYSFKSNRENVLIGSIVSGEQDSGFDSNRVSILTPESSPYTDRFRSESVKIQDKDEHNEDEDSNEDCDSDEDDDDNQDKIVGEILRERYRYMRALPRIEKNQTRLLTPSSSPYNDRFEPVSIARSPQQSRNLLIESLQDSTANSLREHYSRLENNQTRLLSPSSSPYYDRFARTHLQSRNSVIQSLRDSTANNFRFESYQSSFLSPEPIHNYSDRLRSVINTIQNDDDDENIIGHIQVSEEMRPVYKGTRDWIRTGACFYFTPGGNKTYLNAVQKTRIFLR